MCSSSTFLQYLKMYQCEHCAAHAFSSVVLLKTELYKHYYFLTICTKQICAKETKILVAGVTSGSTYSLSTSILSLFFKFHKKEKTG